MSYNNYQNEIMTDIETHILEIELFVILVLVKQIFSAVAFKISRGYSMNVILTTGLTTIRFLRATLNVSCIKRHSRSFYLHLSM